MLKQQLNLKLSQKLSPQQIQLMKMIQLPTQAFEQRIAQELQENPALERGKEEEDSFENEYDTDNYDDNYDDGNEVIETDFDVDEYLSDDEIPSYKLSANNYSADDEEREIPFAAGMSFNQYLLQQLNTFRLEADEKEIARFLVGSIDESGYLRRESQEIVDDLAFTQNLYTTEEKVEKVLKVVQQLDPSGVGARDLQECLLIQLDRKDPTPSINLAKTLLAEYFEPFSKKHYSRLIERLNISEDQLREAIREIELLNPKPGGSYSGNTRIIEHIVPDFTIRIIDGELDLTLNGRNAPELHVSPEYANMLLGYKEAKEKSQAQRDAALFIKQKLDAAKWFIDAIRQRQQTLFVTMNAIMEHQKEYFLTGDERKLKPMILKDIADKINMDVSTVSRVANSKYIDTPYGTKFIKDLFSESMKNDQGEDVSTLEIKKILEITIAEENKRKPLTDDRLAKILLEKGYPIARRTVAKYREQLDIPVARLRKEI
ncbi:MAG TPA: RNA polymerase factor sigma-54 [Flavobacteriaceae bacterium]|nr:RNA polymerase factor sigma-54 [Flavobacteriaceae bacterium]